MVPTKFNPKFHHVFKCDLSRWLKRKYKNPKLFVYRHKDTQNFVICEWLHEDDGKLMDELLIVGKHPQMFSKAHVAKLDWLLDGPAVDAHRVLHDQERGFQDQMQEWGDEDRDLYRYITNKTGVGAGLFN